MGRGTFIDPGTRVRSFDEFCDDFRVTASERSKLAHHLGSIRYQRTVEVLCSPDVMAEYERRDQLRVLR